MEILRREATYQEARARQKGKIQMRVYKSSVGNIASYFDNINDAVAECREILENGLPGDYNEYSICEMTKEEFEALPEFEGK